MTDNDLITLLRCQLQLPMPIVMNEDYVLAVGADVANDIKKSQEHENNYLLALLNNAKKELSRFGITLKDEIDDNMLIVRYASYVYKARDGAGDMPRSLTLAINNRLFSEKGAIE